MNQYRLKKQFPGLDKNIIVGDIFKIKPGYSTYSVGKRHSTAWDEVYFQDEEYFEKIIMPDFEILSFIDSKDNLISLKENNVFIFKDSVRGATKEYLLADPIEYHIHSVMRLSDGQVFTIGDRAKTQGKYPHTITSFKISQKTSHRTKEGWVYDGIDRIWVNWEINAGGNWLESTEMCHPLFITVDGVAIYEKDIFWVVGGNGKPLDYNKEPKSEIALIGTGQLHETKYETPSLYWAKFSTKEAAQEYLLKNNPCLSIQILIDIISGLPEKEGGHNIISILSEINKFVKNK